MTGCYNISGFTGKWKIVTFKSWIACKDFVSLADIFYSKDAEEVLIAESGTKLIATIYTRKKLHWIFDVLKFMKQPGQSLPSNLKNYLLPKDQLENIVL